MADKYLDDDGLYEFASYFKNKLEQDIYDSYIQGLEGQDETLEELIKTNKFEIIESNHNASSQSWTGVSTKTSDEIKEGTIIIYHINTFVTAGSQYVIALQITSSDNSYFNGTLYNSNGGLIEATTTSQLKYFYPGQYIPMIYHMVNNSYRWICLSKWYAPVSTQDNVDGLMTVADKTKLDGIASGATANTGTVTSVAVKMNGSTKGTVTTSGTIDLGTVITSHQDISGKVNVANIDITGQTTTLLSLTQSLATNGIHYARWYSKTDGGSSGISDKPTGTTNAGFVCEACCNRYNTSTDYRYILQCWSSTNKAPYVAVVQSDTSSLSWTLLPTTNTTYSDATTSVHGLMSTSDKTKLDGIAAGAEVNQNAFSNVKVGSTTVAADAKTDTLELVAGSNVTLTPDATNDKITIAATDTTYNDATTSTHGLMSTSDKTKLDNITDNRLITILDNVSTFNISDYASSTNSTGVYKLNPASSTFSFYYGMQDNTKVITVEGPAYLYMIINGGVYWKLFYNDSNSSYIVCGHLNMVSQDIDFDSTVPLEGTLIYKGTLGAQHSTISSLPDPSDSNKGFVYIGGDDTNVMYDYTPVGAQTKTLLYIYEKDTVYSNGIDWIVVPNFRIASSNRPGLMDSSQLSKLDSLVYNDSNLIGSITLYAGSTAPNGYMICDGSEISRTTYSALFNVIGTTYGQGNGQSTFNIPNLKGKIPVGYDSSDTNFDTLGETGGEKTHTLTTAEIPAHTHTYTDYTAKASSTAKTWDTTKTQNSVTGVGNDTNTRTTNSNTNAGGAHNNMQPYIVLNYIIKVSGASILNGNEVNY